MGTIERRGFLKLAGAGSAAAAALAGAGSAVAAVLAGRGPALAGAIPERAPGNGPFTFRAVAPLPQPPHNAWAAQVVDGTVDLAEGTGLVTSRVMAAGVALPGFTEVLRVTGASRHGRRVRLNAVADGRSRSRPGQNSRAVIVVDSERGLVRAPFLGRPIEHRLAPGGSRNGPPM